MRQGVLEGSEGRTSCFGFHHGRPRISPFWNSIDLFPTTLSPIRYKYTKCLLPHKTPWWFVRWGGWTPVIIQPSERTWYGGELFAAFQAIEGWLGKGGCATTVREPCRLVEAKELLTVLCFHICWEGDPSKMPALKSGRGIFMIHQNAFAICREMLRCLSLEHLV